MANDLLIVTSGSSQLITQISALQQLGLPVKGAKVIYNGVSRESLQDFFKQMAFDFEFEYIGDILFKFLPKPLNRKNRFTHGIGLTSLPQEHEIFKVHPVLKPFKRVKRLVITVRVKIPEDVVLIGVLNPRAIIYTADGVVDHLPPRNFTAPSYSYLHKGLEQFPTNHNIYSPSFLKKDISNIGVYVNTDISDILNQMKTLPLVDSCYKKYFSQRVKGVIISQHFHLSEKVTFDNDINYYLSMGEFLKTIDEDGVIIFKPHPRDTAEKINILTQQFGKNFVVIEDVYQALPIELFEDSLKDSRAVFITGNSSAPLYFKDTNQVVTAYSKVFLSEELNEKIRIFSSNHDLTPIELK